MAKIQVTSANSNSIFQAGRSVFRVPKPYHGVVGSELTIGTLTYPSIAKLSSTRIVVANDADNTLRTYDFNGSTWSEVGNSKSITFSFPSITALSSTRICLLNPTGSTLQAYDFDGTDWNAVGSSFSLTAITGISGITALSSTSVALADSTNDFLATYTFNGSTWSQTGNALTITGLNTCSIAALSSTRVAIAHNSTNQIRAYDFNGTNWSQTGSAATPALSGPSISAVSSSEILLSHYGDSAQFVYTFDGNSWTLKKTLDIVISSTAWTAICSLDNSTFAFLETGNTSLRAFEYGIASCPVILTFFPKDIQVWIGNGSNPSTFITANNTIAGTEIAKVAGAMDSNGILHICWLEDNAASSDLVYRTYNCITNTWGTNTIINADIGGDPYFTSLFLSICVDSNDKPHIGYTAYPSISGGATYALWYTQRTSDAWSTNVQVQHVKNRNCYGIDISTDLDNFPVISVGTDVAANGTTVYRGNQNNATSFTAYILNSTTAHHLTSLCFATNGDCYVISFNAVNSITVANVWKHGYNADWGTWTSMDFTFPNSAIRNTAPSLAWVDNKLYLFIEDNFDHDIKYATHDGASWSSLTTLETGTFNSAISKWSLWLDSDSIGSVYSDIGTHNKTVNHNGYAITGIVNSSLEKRGQTIITPADNSLISMHVRLSKGGTPTDGLILKIYIGSFSGTLIATSDAIPGSLIATTARYFHLKFSSFPELQPNTTYYLVLERTGAASETNYYWVGAAASSYAGSFYTLSSGNWVESSSIDMDFYLRYYRPHTELDYIFRDETATPDVWLNNISLVIPTFWLVKSLKWYNGASWVEKPLKYHNGSTWVTKPVKINM